jgi:hypothetical protein
LSARRRGGRLSVGERWAIQPNASDGLRKELRSMLAITDAAAEAIRGVVSSHGVPEARD